jgi:hypothetical protein
MLRQKMAHCGMMFIDLPDGCCYGDQNTWNKFPVSKQKITLNNQITNNQTKQIEQNINRSKYRMIEQDEQMRIRNNWKEDE